MKAVKMEIAVRKRQRIAAVPFSSTTIIKVYYGRKVVGDRTHQVVATAGDYLAVADGQLLNLENIPEAGRGYRAVCLSIIDDGRESSPTYSESATPWTPLPATNALTQAFAHTESGAADGIESGLMHHRASELFAAAVNAGFRPPPIAEDSVSDRLRQLIVERPADDWRAEEVAATLNMSVATLRRRLAAESTGFRDLLRDVRLVYGFSLVQGTSMALNLVAAESGYDSLSHFTARFRERFGCPPSALRD